jgi:hypothetical protein
VKLSRNIANQLEQPGLHVHVEIFKFLTPREPAFGDFTFDLPQPIDDLPG